MKKKTFLLEDHCKIRQRRKFSWRFFTSKISFQKWKKRILKWNCWKIKSHRATGLWEFTVVAKTHPYQNTASIAPKITIRKSSAIQKPETKISSFVQFWNGLRAKLFSLNMGLCADPVDICDSTFMIFAHVKCFGHNCLWKFAQYCIVPRCLVTLAPPS